MLKSLSQALLAGFILLLPIIPALAAEGDVVEDEELMRLLKLRVTSEPLAQPQETRVDGVYQTRIGNRYGYLIEGGRYIVIGEMIDLKMAQNLTELSHRNLVVEEFANFPSEGTIVFPAEKEERAVLNVLTDTSCGYCQVLHKEVKFLQAAGISVRYFPYPRGGSRGPGYDDLRRVWCSDDKREAMSIAKKASPGELSENGACAEAEAVDKSYKLGNRLGINGTPALYAGSGAAFPGYVPYQQLGPQLVGPEQFQ